VQFEAEVQSSAFRLLSLGRKLKLEL
jgi:hypothetical protein